ncbi:unnamed protein product, partial [Thlaspi arvense]
SFNGEVQFWPREASFLLCKRRDVGNDVCRHQAESIYPFATSQPNLSWKILWPNSLRWVPTSTDFIIAAEKRLLSILKTPYVQEQVNIGSGPPGSKIRWFRSSSDEARFINTVTFDAKEDAPTLVMVHGYGASQGFFFRNFDALASRFRVIAIDQLGWGGSSRPDFTCKSTEETEAWFIDSLEEWRKSKNLSNFILLGHSFGGYVAAKYALKHPEHLQHLVLVGPAGFSAESDSKSERLTKFRATWKGAVLNHLLESNFTPQKLVRGLGPWGPGLVNRYTSARFGAHSEGTVLTEEESRLLTDYVYHTLAAKASGELCLKYIFSFGAFARKPLFQSASEWKVPTTFIYGVHDWMDYKGAEEARKDMKVPCEIIRVPQGGHFVFIDNPAGFRSAVLYACRKYISQDSSHQEILPDVVERETWWSKHFQRPCGHEPGENQKTKSEEEKMSAAGEEKILVSVRVRPLNQKEKTSHDRCEWECINDTTIICNSLNLPDKPSYTFDKVFGFECPTKQVYDDGAKEVALCVLSGINASIFAYGQTSSGKTYTMTGITAFAIDDIFLYIDKHKQERKFTLKFSAMEIYNEAVRDLLCEDSNNTPLRLLDDPERGTVVEKLKEETLTDRNHLDELLSICETQRKIGETSLNETSSRSHQILRLTIESSKREISPESSGILAASVCFVDLAGSERASQTLSAGSRLKEGCHINRSLLTLGTVIRKLSKGRNGHIPYRDSKLTRILQNSLGGNARTAIICTMSPARTHLEQSRNTLLFATCAKEVTTNAQMEEQILELKWQRDVAQSRVENLLKSTADERSYYSSSVDNRRRISYDSTDFDETRMLNNLGKSNFYSPDEDDFLLDDTTPQFPVHDLCDQWEEMAKENIQEPEDACKEVRCVEVNSGEAERAKDSLDIFGKKLETLPAENEQNFKSFMADEKAENEAMESKKEHSDSSLTTMDMELSLSDKLEAKDELTVNKLLQEVQETEQPVEKQMKSPKKEENMEQNLSKDQSYLEYKQNYESFMADKNEAMEQEKEDADSSVKMMDIQFSSSAKRESRDKLPIKKLVEEYVQETEQSVEKQRKSSKKEDLEHNLWPMADENEAMEAEKENADSSLKTMDIELSSSINKLEEESQETEQSVDNDEAKTSPSSKKEDMKQNSSTDQSNDRGDDAYEALKNKVKEMQKTIEYFMSMQSAEDKQSPSFNTIDDYTSPGDCFKMKRSRSCRENLLFTKAVALKNSNNTSFDSDNAVSIDAQSTKDSDTETSCSSFHEFMAGLREMATQHHSTHETDTETEKTKQENNTGERAEFERQQSQIIELWELCNVPLVHRTYFFLLFKGDPSDFVYMEVELRRLSFLKDSRETSRKQTAKAVAREREWLAKQIPKKFGKKEREEVYKRWGVELSSKQRSMQVAHKVWMKSKEIEHCRESASLVATLVGFVESNLAPKEMFGLSFSPTTTLNVRSSGWRFSNSFSRDADIGTIAGAAMAHLIRPIRQLSPQCHHHFRNLRHFLSKRLPNSPSSIPSLLLSPSFSTSRSPPRRRFRPAPPEALIPTLIAEDDGGSDGSESDPDSSRSRNQRKRDARRAVRWGMELASFSSDQIKRIMKAASLGEEVYDALMLAKRLGSDVREGRRRHYNFIGKMLREVEPDLMDTLINATNQGDHTKLQALISSAKDGSDDAGGSNVDDTETESEDDVESSDEYMATAARWFDGLISQNVELTKEVYSLQSVDFDRQELRKLVRKVQLVHELRKDVTPEKQKEVDDALMKAEKSLNRFLHSMAKQMQSEESDLYL